MYLKGYSGLGVMEDGEKSRKGSNPDRVSRVRRAVLVCALKFA